MEVAGIEPASFGDQISNIQPFRTRGGPYCWWGVAGSYPALSLPVFPRLSSLHLSGPSVDFLLPRNLSTVRLRGLSARWDVC